MSQAGLINVIDNNPDIPIMFDGNTGSATAIGNVLNIVGVTAQGVSTSATSNTVTITVADATTASKGVAQFNPADFSVTAGVVSFTGGGGFVTSVSGTANRITSTGGATPVIDIAATYVGQSSITTLGTVTTGVWNATAIGATFGGTGQTGYTTGDILYASNATTLSKLGIGSSGQVLTVSAGLPSWQTDGGGTVTSVSGTANRITSTGGTTPVIDIAATYIGQTSIITLGTITTGVWNGTAVDATHGGTAQTSWATGDILYASGVNTLAKLTAGSNTQVLTLAGGVPIWATPTTGTVTSVSGTTNRITSTGGATPVIDISAAYVGQTSITTLGTITTGTWNGTVIGVIYGGTGLNSAAQGDLLYGSASNTYSLLNKNTTATRYLSNTGTSNNPAWAQVDLSNGVTGVLPLANGGTNANLTASNGGIFYSTSTAGAILAGTATAGQVLRSGASTTPSWSTATYPATAGTSGNVLTSDGTNWNSTTPASPAFNPNSVLQLVDDFVGWKELSGAYSSSLGWSTLGSNLLGTNSATPDSAHPGIAATGQMTSGLGGIMLAPNSSGSKGLILGGGAITLNFVIKIGTLSVNGTRYTLRFGLGDVANGADQTNGVYFEYSDNINSGNWVGKTASASSRSTANSSTAANTSFHNFQISINAAATSVSFYIDGAEIANSPLTSNIPTASASPFFCATWVSGTVAAASVILDLFYLQQTLTTAR